jgi:hypothetical protein
MIDGESFLVDLDKQVTVEAQDKPEVKHRVALRVAMQQRVELNTLRFQYEMPATLTDDQGKSERTARLRHELGFLLLITDLGPPLEAAVQDSALKVLTEPITKNLEESHFKNIEVAKPHRGKFTGCQGPGVKIHYQDRQDYDQTCFAYVLIGPTFTCSCFIQFFDKDKERVFPLIKTILNSIEGAKKGG